MGLSARLVSIGAGLAGLALATIVAAQAPNAQVEKSQDPEAADRMLLTRALASANKYANPNLYRFAPRRNADERAASTVAITAHILLEAYRAGAGANFLAMAREAGDDLLANSDLDGDGKVGWGRFWSPDRGTSRPGDGSNTTFSRDCPLPRNTPYADELYDDARIGQFLVELSRTSGDPRYLNAVKAMLAATWNLGAVTPGGASTITRPRGHATLASMSRMST